MRIFLLAMAIFICPALGLATTIDLNDGTTVQGKIVAKNSDNLQVQVDGVEMTYYADEIKDIDGRPFASSPASVPSTDAAAPAAAPTPAMPLTSAAPATSVAPNTTLVSSPSNSSISPEKRALILKFIDVFGTRQALENNFQTMLDQVSKDKPQEAQQIRQRVKVDEIIDRLIPVYDRNFTTEDLKAFIAFYDSPAGRKLIATIPDLMKESVQESIQYMQEKFPEVKDDQQR